MRAKSGLMTITHICNFKASILGVFAAQKNTTKHTAWTQHRVSINGKHILKSLLTLKADTRYMHISTLEMVGGYIRQRDWECTIHGNTIEIVYSSARLRMYMGIQLIGFWCQIGSWGPEPTKHIAQWGHHHHHQCGTHKIENTQKDAWFSRAFSKL